MKALKQRVKGSCRNLVKKPWVFIRALNLNPNILGS